VGVGVAAAGVTNCGEKAPARAHIGLAEAFPYVEREISPFRCVRPAT